MRERGRDPGGAQRLEVSGLAPVGAGHLRPERLADEGEAAHPGTADRDEVQPAALHAVELSHWTPPRAPLARSAAPRPASPACVPRSTTAAAGPRRRAAPTPRPSAATLS